MSNMSEVGIFVPAEFMDWKVNDTKNSPGFEVQELTKDGWVRVSEHSLPRHKAEALLVGYIASDDGGAEYRCYETLLDKKGNVV